MKIEYLEEPLLEFGSGRHIDVRFGIAQLSPLDHNLETAPHRIRVGILGTAETTEKLRGWLEEARDGIPQKRTDLPNLFPAFPGFDESSCFGCQLVFDERWTSIFSQREIDDLIASNPLQVIEDAVDAFVSSGKRLLESSSIDVLVCAPPADLLAVLDSVKREPHDDSESSIDEGSEANQTGSVYQAEFHDLLKAVGMSLGIPIQMIRPPTYGGKHAKPQSPKDGREKINTMQDSATRAWNFHTAMYYKAGGIPWRLVRESSDLASCFAGISFYRTLDRERLLTSVAQVFNERGEGIIVRGAEAVTSKTDRQPHLTDEDAYELIDNAIKTFRREHRHMPARLVLHKTSKFTSGEIEGVMSAISKSHIEMADLVSLSRSFSRLFRTGSYPPLRGTLLNLDTNLALLYTRGSVPFFECYPGMYVPRPLEIKVEKTESTLHTISEEILALTKLNWNNTQFDGGEPITVRAARRVGDILKCIPMEGGVIQPGFRFFM